MQHATANVCFAPAGNVGEASFVVAAAEIAAQPKVTAAEIGVVAAAQPKNHVAQSFLTWPAFVSSLQRSVITHNNILTLLT